MTNDPYRDPSGPGGPPPGDRGGTEPPAPDTAWMPPADPTAPGGGQTEPYRPPSDQSQPPAYQQPPAYPPPGGEVPAGEAPPYQASAGESYAGAAGQPAPGQPYQAPPAPGYPGGPRPTNGLAVAALVCSIAGVLTLISAPVGAVLGHLALRQIAQTGEEGTPLAKAAIWVGWIITGLVVVACCAVVTFAIAASRSGTEFGPR